MKTIQTKPDCTLGFLPLGNWPKEWPINAVVELSHNQSGKSICKLSEITEEQAKELVSEVQHGEFMVEGHGIMEFLTTVCRYKLKKAALSVGIKEEEFDKYLVIKL